MAINRQDALAVVEDFKLEFPALANLNYVLLGTEKDFHDHYGKNAGDAIREWQNHLAAYERTTQTVLLLLASHGSAKELQDSLSHEGVGHSGINTFSAGEKRALLDALLVARQQPGMLKAHYWKSVEVSYAGISRSEQAEEVFCAVVEHALSKRDYQPAAFEHAWQRSIVGRDEPLKLWGVMQVAQHIAHGLRENTRRHQIFPANDFEQFRTVDARGQLGEAERQARQLLGKDGAQVRAATGTGVYVGAIVGETPTHWIQRLSPNTAILHDKSAVAGAAVGQAGTLRYRQGRAELAPARDQDRGRSLSR